MENLHFVTLSEGQLTNLIETASTRAAHVALQLAGVPVVEYYTRADLSRMLGRGKVNRMINKLTPHSIDGGRVKYSLSEVLTNVL